VGEVIEAVLVSACVLKATTKKGRQLFWGRKGHTQTKSWLRLWSWLWYDAGMYDMLGNVWEWTSSVYKPVGHFRDRNKPKYTAKGGSFADQSITISSRFERSL